MALSGGSTPRRLYELLASEYAGQIDWTALEVFFGDERAVPSDHPDSNFRMASEALLDRVPLDRERLHRMPADSGDPVAAAAAYESVLRERVASGPDGFPALDLVWLGIGDDGHTASLFPGTEALEERRACVVANEVPQLGTWRMTLTFPALCAARRVQFLVTGASKARIVEAIERARSSGDLERYPATRVVPREGEVEWLLDRAAAGKARGG